MKNAILLHGAGSTPESFWFPWLKKELEKKGYSVWVPALPRTSDPILEEQLAFVLSNGTFNEETVIVTHSAGGPLALCVLQNIGVRIKKAILVAGYCSKLTVPGAANKILPKNFNWKKIKEHCEEFVFLNSDNDPWGCGVKQGKAMQKMFGGRFILMKKQGHMGSLKFKQPYKEFPELLELIE